MPPELWAFLIIAVAVWIIASLFRNRGDDRLRPERDRPTRRTAQDLDRFLDEARRRRALGQPPAPRAEPAPRPVPRRPNPPQAAPPRPAAAAPRKPPRPTAAPPAPRRVTVREVVPVVVVEKKAAPIHHQLAALDAIPEVIPLAGEPASPRAVQPPPPRAATTPPRPRSPLLGQVTALLRSPQSARAAIVLNEILGPPLCRRRR